MPQHTTYTVGANWVLLTDANIASATFQNTGDADIWVTSTNGTTPPAAGTTLIKYQPTLGERNVSLADLTPGVTGANRIWARAVRGSSTVFISHA